jgi:hypothetical protein
MFLLLKKNKFFFLTFEMNRMHIFLVKKNIFFTILYADCHHFFDILLLLR